MKQPDTLHRFDFGPAGNRLVAASGILLVLGLAALSLWLASTLAGLAADVWRARDWSVSQATVLHVSMSAAREPRRLGFYGVRIKYRYLHGDNSYESSRLVFTGQSTETVDVWNGRWLSAVVEFIENSRLSGRPVPVFVNPRDPTEAVVFRDMVWGNYLLLSLSMIALAFLLALATRACLWPWLGRRAAARVAVGLAMAFPLAALAGALLAVMT